MLKIDLVIGGVIGAAILFSLLGVATYDRAAGDSPFEITWNTTSAALPNKADAQTGNTAAGGKSIDYPISVRNLTAVDLNVRIQGNSAVRPSAVTVQIKVTPVNGTEQTKTVTLPQGQPGSAQSADFMFKVQDLPNATETQGRDANTTKAELDSQYGNTKGAGTWKVTVTVTGGTAVPAAEQYTITISGQAKSFAADVQTSTPDIQR